MVMMMMLVMAVIMVMMRSSGNDVVWEKRLGIQGSKKGKAGNDLVFLALKRAIFLNPTNPYYHLKLAWHTLDQGKLDENLDHLGSYLAAAEKELSRAIYFMPQSAHINFSVGCYWIWKSKVVEDEKTYLDAFDRFIRYFQTVYHINSGYKKKIQEVVQQYYPIKDILKKIFLP